MDKTLILATLDISPRQDGQRENAKTPCHPMTKLSLVELKPVGKSQNGDIFPADLADSWWENQQKIMVQFVVGFHGISKARRMDSFSLSPFFIINQMCVLTLHNFFVFWMCWANCPNGRVLKVRHLGTVNWWDRSGRNPKRGCYWAQRWTFISLCFMCALVNNPCFLGGMSTTDYSEPWLKK